MKCPYCGELIDEDLIHDRDPNWYDTYDSFKMCCPHCDKVIEITPEEHRTYEGKIKGGN